MLTLEDLKAMQPEVIFRRGLSRDEPGGINMTRSGGYLQWIAVRGDIWDWAIYCAGPDKSAYWIRDYGDKVTDKETIRRLVSCDDEAFKMYRY